MPPLILISCCVDYKGIELDDLSTSLSARYPNAVHAAGGIPVLLPNQADPAYLAEAVARADGVMLSGGHDVEPKLYQQDLPPALRKTIGPVTPERDLFELLLIDEVFRQRKPLFTICRGHQILNVALGGTLYADIRTQVPEALEHGLSERNDEIVHAVTLEADSLAARAAGTTILGVNSVHHQAVDQIAQPLRATGLSSDGIIEIMELHPAARRLLPYLLSVQFHPERMFAQHAEHLNLLKSFTGACGRTREHK